MLAVLMAQELNIFRIKSSRTFLRIILAWWGTVYEEIQLEEQRTDDTRNEHQNVSERQNSLDAEKDNGRYPDDLQEK